MGRSSKTDDYYQFPLCLLTLPVDKEDLVQHIVSFVLVEKGAIIRDKINENAEYAAGYEILTEYRNELGISRMDEVIDSLNGKGRLPADFDASNSVHVAIAAMIFVHDGIGVGSCEASIDRHRRCQERVIQFEGRAGRDTEVRIRYDIIWQLDKGDVSLREFRVLAGFYAGIGNKPFASVTLKRLCYLSAGFKSEQAFERGSPAFESGLSLLTVDQIRKTRDDLVRLRFLHSYYDGRRCWYSNRIRSEQIMERRLKKREYKLKAEIQKQNLRAEARERLNDLERELVASKQRVQSARLKRAGKESYSRDGIPDLLINETNGDGRHFNRN